MKCKHHEHVFYPIVEGQWALQLLTSRMNWPEQQLCIDFTIPHYFSANNYCHCQHAGRLLYWYFKSKSLLINKNIVVLIE